jgi:hypothetical protein
MSWMRGDAGTQSIFFRPFGFDLTPIAGEVELTAGTRGERPAMVWNGNAFSVAWTRSDAVSSVWGAVVDAKSVITTPLKKISDSSRFARDPVLIALGDRTLLVDADNRDQNTGYEIYSRMLTPTLDPYPNSNSARVTSAVGDSIAPYAKFGPKGDVGILFRDDRNGPAQTYFTHLSCEAGAP